MRRMIASLLISLFFTQYLARAEELSRDTFGMTGIKWSSLVKGQSKPTIKKKEPSGRPSGEGWEWDEKEKVWWRLASPTYFQSYTPFQNYFVPTPVRTAPTIICPPRG